MAGDTIWAGFEQVEAGDEPLELTGEAEEDEDALSVQWGRIFCLPSL
jgi:hypothetical protein